jgi:putative transcriptional regulator
MTLSIPTAEEILEARKKAGLTQTEAGKLVHASLRGWQDWEYGKREMPLVYWELFLLKTKQAPSARLNRLQ